MSYITKTYLETQFKNFAEKIKSLLNNKVDKVEGKGLSTNDLTSELKSNYDTAYDHSQSDHAPSNAQANVIETVEVNGTALTPSSKAVNVTVPTKVSQLSNDSGYLTEHQDISGKANTVDLAKVAMSGSYNDLSNKPTIPNVGNGTVIIKQDGTNKGTFTMNQSGDTTIELTDNNTTYGVATQSANGLESAADKKKLDGIATGAEVNQNAFSNVVVGSTTISADSKTDSLTLAGSNVTITPDADNDKVTIGITKANVTSALGYTPPTSNTNTTYSLSKSGSTITLTGSDGSTTSVTDTDTNTHYTSKNVVGSSTATSNTTTALTNGNVYLNSVENGAVTSAHKISGSGATTVTTDTSGNIIISSTDTNTTYSAATASAAGLMSASDKSKLDGITSSADSVSFSQSLTSGTKVGTITINGTGTDLYCQTNTDTHYTTGLKVGASNTATANAAATNGNVYLNVLDNTTVRDSHKIVGSGATTVTSDANGVITISSTDTNTNTTYSAGTGLSLSGTTFNHKNSVTAGTAQGDANKTLAFGGTFTIPTVTYDAQGHITGKGTTTMTMPANPNTDTKNTAGSTDTSSKIFLVGATSQATNPQTYSHDTAYVGTDGCLYSNNKKVSVDGHIHDSRYYTETEIDNKLDSISGTIFNLGVSTKKFTYTVYSPDSLKDWIENKSGNDYTSVLIKKGTYQYTVRDSNNFVSVNKQGTLYIEGEEGSKLSITYDANVNSHYYLIRGVEKTDEDTSEIALDMYPDNPTNLEISSTTTSENISRNRMSLNNVNIYLETYAHKNSSEYYIGILRFANGVNNCRFEIKLQCSCKQTTACCYYTCTNLNNCKGITTANYDSTLTPKTGYDRLRPYYNCRRVINCYAYGSGGYSGGAFYNGDHIINCNAKFVDMYYGETFYKVSHVIGCRSYASVGTENGGSACAYKNCKKMLYNYAAAGSYSGSYASDNTDSTYLCANTLNGGWNS